MSCQAFITITKNHPQAIQLSTCQKATYAVGSTQCSEFLVYGLSAMISFLLKFNKYYNRSEKFSLPGNEKIGFDWKVALEPPDSNTLATSA